MHENTSHAVSAEVALDRLPDWATESYIEDGYVYSKRPTRTVDGAELVQASHLVIESGTVKYYRDEEPTIWLPDSTDGLTLEQAGVALKALQELLPILQGCAEVSTPRVEPAPWSSTPGVDQGHETHTSDDLSSAEGIRNKVKNTALELKRVDLTAMTPDDLRKLSVAAETLFNLVEDQLELQLGAEIIRTPGGAQ